MPLLAQRYTSTVNSSTTLLAGNATFAGGKEKASDNHNVYAYNWITVTVKSAQSGSGKVYQSKDGTTWDHVVAFTYTGTDTLTNTTSVPILLDYFKITYTNGASAQTTFRLTTVLTNQIMPLDATGNVKIAGTITGGSTSANQKLLYTVDSLIQINTKRVADSLKVWRLRLDTTYQRYKVGAVVQNFPTNPTTSIRQDSLLALLKYLGRSLTLPYFVRGTGQFPPVRDSLVGQTAKVIDVRYSDGTYPTKTNLTLTNLTGTTDTVRIKTWCVAKNDSSYFNVGWKDRSSGVSAVGTPDGNEPDNSLIIIPANTSRTFESDGNGKVSVIRIMWKTTAGKTSTKLYISTQKIN